MFTPQNTDSIRKENTKLFFCKRAIFFAGGIETREKPASKEPEEAFIQQTEKEKILGDDGVPYKNDLKATLRLMAEKVYKTKTRRDKYEKELFLGLQENVPKAYGNKVTAETYWAKLGKQGCDKVTIVDGNCIPMKGREIIRFAFQAGKEKPKEGPFIRAIPSVAIDTETPAPEPTPITPESGPLITQFKEWFGKDAQVKKSETSINSGTYFVRNKEAGYGGGMEKIYVAGGDHVEASYSRVSGSAFSQTEVKDPTVMEVNGIKYAHITGGNFNGRRLNNGWVRLDLLRSSANEDAAISVNSGWSNPDKPGSKAEKIGNVDKLGAHFIKNDTKLFNYRGEEVMSLPSNRDKAEAFIIDKNLYKINGETFVRIQFRYKETEGWVRYADLDSTEKVRILETDREKEEKRRAAEVTATRAQYETGKGGTLEFTPQQQETVKLRNILKYAEPGDQVDITTDKGLKRTATFRNGEFFYANNRRAVVLRGYSVGELRKVPKAEVKERAKEGANAFGSIELRNPETRPGLRNYHEIAETILKAESIKKLQDLGFDIKDEKSLRDLQKSGINSYDYADNFLKPNQVGDTVFVILVNKSTIDRLKEMEKRTKERRGVEKIMLDFRERKIVSSKSRYLEEGSEKTKFKTAKEIIRLAQDAEAWTKAWETEGSIQGEENLVHIWNKMAPGRSENELPDLVRKFIKDAHDEDFKDGFNSFIKFSKLYTKENGQVGTGDELFKEYEKARSQYNKLSPKVLKIFETGGEGDLRLDVITEKMRVNREAGRDSLYGLSENERRFATSFTQGDAYKTYERYTYLNNLMAGSLLMMDGIAELVPLNIQGEAVSERPLNKAESRLNLIFDRKDKGDITMGGIAGERGQEGEMTKFDLFWITFFEENKNTFSKFSSGEAAFVNTLDKCRDPNTHEVDEKKLMAKLNELLQLGIWGLARNPDVNTEDMYKELGLRVLGKNASKQEKNSLEKTLFDQLKFSNLEAPKDEKIMKYQQLLVQTGYLIDQSAGEGKVEKYEAGAQELNVEKLSDVPAMRAIQAELLRKGYPPDKIDKVPELIKNQMVAGVIVDVGTYDTKEGQIKKPGFGVGGGIPVGYGFDVGLGVGYFNGVAQLGFGVGFSGKLGEHTEGGIGLGANLPLAGNLEQAGGPKISPTLGLGMEHTIPIDNSSWDFFVSAGASTDIRKIIEEGGNVGVGAMVGFKWNATKAMDLGTREKLAEYEMEQIDDAMKKGDKEKALDLMMSHRTFGKLATYLHLKYGWSAEDVFNEFQKQKQALRDATARGLEPVITRIGIGAQVGIGPEGVQAGPSVALAFAIAKTVTLYRSESRTPQAMALGGDAALDRQLMEQARKQFGKDTKIEIHGRTIAEAPVELVRHDDGQLAVGVREGTIDLKTVLPANQRNLPNINESLRGTGVTLRPSTEKETAGLLEVVIPELEMKKDPTYNLRSTRVYIDPALEKAGGGKGLIVKKYSDGSRKIFLATTVNPDLVFRRLDYTTQFHDRDGASAHTILAITDTPQRTIDEIKKASGFFVQKRPGQALGIRGAGNGVDQRNIQYYEGYQKNPNYFERYSENEKNWTPYLEAAQGRRAIFEDLSSEKIRPGFTREGLKAKGSFSEKFYNKYHTLYKNLTTVGRGGNLDFKTLHTKIQEEFKKNPAYNNTPLTVAELSEVSIDLTRRSWSSLGNNPEARKLFFADRLAWAEKEVGPLWQGSIDEINKRNPGTIKSNAKELLGYVIQNLYDTDVNGKPTPLKPGSMTTTLAGTERSKGYRPNPGVPGLLGLDLYEEYLGQPGKQGEIARVILETQSPLSENDKEFMQSPLALRALGKLGLILYFTPAESNAITESFKSGVVSPSNKAGFDKFKDLVFKIREAQLNKASGNMVRLDNGYFVRLRPTEIASGVDPSCANFSMSANEDFDLVVLQPSEGGIVVGSRAKEHLTVNASEVPAWFHLGIGAFGMIKPGKEPPPPPPSSDKSEGGRGGKSTVGGGTTGGGTEEVKTDDTQIGRGSGEGGTPTNPDEVP